MTLCWVFVGVLEARLVLVLVHQLSISLSQLLDGLINPTLLAWLIPCSPDKPNCVGLDDMCTLVGCYPWLCVSMLVPYSFGNHAQLRGGSVAKRLRSMQPMVGWNVAAM